MRARPGPLLLPLVLVASCSPRPEPEPARVSSAWVRPQVEAAAVAAARCLRRDPLRVVEVEASPEAVVRAWVHPPGADATTLRCVGDAAAQLRPEPSEGLTRAMVRGDGKLADPLGARERGLTLRARLIEQLAPVERCRAAHLARHPESYAPGAPTPRVGLLVTVGEHGEIARAEVPASTLDATDNACVLDAVRALRLPPIAGSYRYSYLFGAAYGPGGVLVGASDADAVDPFDVEAAFAALAPRTSPCLALYRTPGDLFVHVRLGNDGVPLDVRLERPLGSREDRPADRCLQAALTGLRVTPFDGAPATVTMRYVLR